MPFRILALGSNSSGQLGIGDSADTSEPQLCLIDGSEMGEADKQVAKIVGGGNHTLVLSSEGRLWAAGKNDDGRCVLPRVTKNLEAFQHVESGGVFTDVAATWEASVIVVGKRHVFTCGSGSKGELGQGRDTLKSPTPRRVAMDDVSLEGDAEVVDVVAGVNHALFLASTGELYGWGTSRKGQLGAQLREDKIVWKPRKIDVPFSVRQAVAGRDFTYVVGHDKQHLLLGDAKHFSDTPNVSVESCADNLICGWSNIYYHSAADLRGFGRNDRGQLPPKVLPPVKHFVAGSEHCVAATENGKVLSWGWGEHGNCGTPVDAKGNVMDRYNIIPLDVRSDETIGGVFAGCATTFIVLRQP